jgi:hypothetical protein
MKHRLSASIDEDVFAAAEAAVRAGHAPSMSALVEEAMKRQVARTSRLAAMDEFIAAYEAEFGAFEPGEIDRIERESRANAIVVRPRSSRRAA